MDKLGMKAVFDGTSGIVSIVSSRALAPRPRTRLSARALPRNGCPAASFFLEKYAQQDAGTTEAYRAFAFAAMNLIVDTMGKAGPDRKKVVEELGQVKTVDTIVGTVTFDDHGENTVPLIPVCNPGRQVRCLKKQRDAAGQRKFPGRPLARRTLISCANRQREFRCAALVEETAKPPHPSPLPQGERESAAAEKAFPLPLGRGTG